MFVLAVVSHGAFMAGGVFMSPHPRVHNAGKVPPPQHNCEVRAVRVHMNAPLVSTCTPHLISYGLDRVGKAFK